MSVSPSAYFSTEIPGVVATGGADAFVAVAGLDMLNHSARPSAFWKVHGNLMEGTGKVRLQCNQQVAPGTELCLAYGHEGNEALLFRYGFVQENNEHDSVMLNCPMGPKHEWDESMRTKFKLLQACSIFLWHLPPASQPFLDRT
jgi:hypothetical protein